MHARPDHRRWRAEADLCGSAKAVVKVGAKTFALAQGECTKTSKYLTLNIGSLFIGQTTTPKPNYLGPRRRAGLPGSSSPPAGRDGAYSSGVVFSVYGTAARGTLVLSGAAGQVAGKPLARDRRAAETLTGQQLTATFHC